MSSSRLRITLTGCHHRLGHLDRLDDEVGAGAGPPAEAAPEEGGFKRHLFRLEPGHAGRGIAVDGLELAAGTDQAAVRLQIDEAVERLHRWHGPGRAPRTRPRSAVSPWPALAGASPSLRATRPGVAARRAYSSRMAGVETVCPLPFLPDDLQQLAPLYRRPVAVGDHRHAGIAPPPPACTPGTASALAASKLLTLPPKTGGRAMTAVSMPGAVTSMPKTRRAVDLGRAVEAVQRLAEQLFRCRSSASVPWAPAAWRPWRPACQS